MSKSKTILAPSYLHNEIINKMFESSNSNYFTNTRIVPMQSLISKQLKEIPSDDEVLFSIFEILNNNTDSFTYLKDMIKYPGFLRQILDFRKLMIQYSIEIDDLPESDDFQKEVKLIISNIIHLNLQDKHLIDSYRDVDTSDMEIYEPFYTSMFDKSVVDTILAKGATSVSLNNNSNAKYFGMSASNKRQEIEACAQYIISEKIRAEEINVVLLDFDNYYHLFETIFNRYKIPFTLVVNNNKLSKIVEIFIMAAKYFHNPSIESYIDLCNSGAFNNSDISSYINYIELFIEDINELEKPFTHIQSNIDESLKMDQKELDKYIQLERRAENVRNQVKFIDSGNPILDAFELCKGHKLSTDKLESKSLIKIKSVIEKHYTSINTDTFELIIDMISRITLEASTTTRHGVLVTNLSHPIFPNKYSFILGSSQNNFPAFKSHSGIFDEDYLKAIEKYPGLKERQQFHNGQSSWIFNSGDQIVFFTPEHDYNGKEIDTSIEISQLLDGGFKHVEVNQHHRYHRVDFNLSKDMAERLFVHDNSIYGSVTKFERYFSCPASFLLQYGLRLRPKHLMLLHVSTLGTVQHNVLENLIKRHSIEYTNIDDNKLASEINCTFSDHLRFFTKQNNLIEVIKARSFYNLKTRLEFLGNYQRNTEFKPIKCEEEFKLTIPSDLGDIKLYGIIDRIDSNSEKIRIIDYKSSRKSMSLDLMRAGKQIQLPTYLYAASKSMNSLSESGYYLSLSNNDISVSSFIRGQVTSDTWLKENKLKGLQVEGGSFDKNDDLYKYNLGLTNWGKNFTERDLELFVNSIYGYVLKCVKEAHFDVTPTKDACTYCDFKSICRNKSLQVKTIVPDEVTDFIFNNDNESGGVDDEVE